MIDITKLKTAKYDDRTFTKGDLGRRMVAVVNGEHLKGVLSGWHNDLCIVKLDSSVGFMCDYLFVPSEECYWQVN